MAASIVMSAQSNTKSEYELERNVQLKSSSLAHTWPEKESDVMKDHNMTTTQTLPKQKVTSLSQYQQTETAFSVMLPVQPGPTPPRMAFANAEIC